MLRAILQLAFDRRGKRLHGRFVAMFDGRQLCASRVPSFAASHILIAEGVPTETPIATRHTGAEFDAMTATVREGAKWTVKEGNTAFPTLRLWRPFSHPDIEPSIRFDERPVLGTGQGIERTQEGRASC
jgi:hypothetical protein